MKIIRDIKNIKLNYPITASIGGFDGVHLGHQKIIKNIVNEASKKNTKSAIVTFNPLPKIFFAKKNFEILSMHKKICILEKFDLDYLIILRFNKNLISMSSKEFIEEILIKKLNIKSLTAGDDFKFGNNQSGTVSDLLEYSKNGHFSMNIEDKHSIGNVRISSSQIREAIITNDFDKAAKMLGRPYSVSGKIIHGEKRGREIGFPTANIKLEPNILLSGVYAVSTIISGSKYNAVANIGYKPTFSGKQYLFEANIFNFSGDLYGERLEFNIISKIRETKRFNNVNELKEHIDKDVLEAKKILNEND